MTCKALILLSLLPNMIWAQATEQVAKANSPTVHDDNHQTWKTGTLNFYLENDLFNETDRHYTNGIRVSWVSPDLSSYNSDPRLPDWVRSTNKKLRFFHDFKQGLQRNVVVSLGQLIFTPEDVDATQVIKDDRPYAGYLYMGFAYHTRSTDQLDTVEVNLGVVGPASQADHTQDFIHDLRNFDKFAGWNNQLKNELTVQLLYEHKRRWILSEEQWLQQDFISHAGVSVGNLASYLNAGGEYRFGWQLPDDFGTSALRPAGDNSAPNSNNNGREGWEVYGLHAFVSIDARLLGNTIFLDGNTFSDSHSVDKKYAVADMACGISFLMAGWKLSYAKVWRTKEFKEQQHHHSYGSISASYSW